MPSEKILSGIKPGLDSLTCTGTFYGGKVNPTELLRHVDDKGWNDYHIVVRGRRVTLMINGVTMCKLVDDDPRRTPAGHLALQTHKGPPMTVQFRNIRIRQ